MIFSRTSAVRSLLLQFDPAWDPLSVSFLVVSSPFVAQDFPRDVTAASQVGLTLVSRESPRTRHDPISCGLTRVRVYPHVRAKPRNRHDVSWSLRGWCSDSETTHEGPHRNQKQAQHTPRNSHTPPQVCLRKLRSGCGRAASWLKIWSGSSMPLGLDVSHTDTQLSGTEPHLPLC